MKTPKPVEIKFYQILQITRTTLMVNNAKIPRFVGSKIGCSAAKYLLVENDSGKPSQETK